MDGLKQQSVLDLVKVIFFLWDIWYTVGRNDMTCGYKTPGFLSVCSQLTRNWTFKVDNSSISKISFISGELMDFQYFNVDCLQIKEESEVGDSQKVLRNGKPVLSSCPCGFQCDFIRWPTPLFDSLIHTLFDWLDPCSLFHCYRPEADKTCFTPILVLYSMGTSLLNQTNM